MRSGTLSDHMLVYSVLNTKSMKPKTMFTKGRSFKDFDEEVLTKICSLCLLMSLMYLTIQTTSAALGFQVSVLVIALLLIVAVPPLVSLSLILFV